MDVAGPLPLALAWQYKCKNFATVERSEFVAYYSSHGIDTLSGMKTDVKRVEALLNNKQSFKEFYRWLLSVIHVTH